MIILWHCICMGKVGLQGNLSVSVNLHLWAVQIWHWGFKEKSVMDTVKATAVWKLEDLSENPERPMGLVIHCQASYGRLDIKVFLMSQKVIFHYVETKSKGKLFQRYTDLKSGKQLKLWMWRLHVQISACKKCIDLYRL